MMTLTALKTRYARLRDEIDAFGTGGQPDEVKLARLFRELDKVDDALTAYRRLAAAAPTLSDIVPLDSADLYLDRPSIPSARYA